MRAIDLLRNHSWNMQALITAATTPDNVFPDAETVAKDATFYVRVEPIKGFGLPRTTNHATEADARSHALAVLGMN